MNILKVVYFFSFRRFCNYSPNLSNDLLVAGKKIEIRRYFKLIHENKS